MGSARINTQLIYTSSFRAITTSAGKYVDVTSKSHLREFIPKYIFKNTKKEKLANIAGVVSMGQTIHKPALDKL